MWLANKHRSIIRARVLSDVVYDRIAHPGNFSAQVSAATAGQTIGCVNGNYGTFTGTNKAITIKALPGTNPTMDISFGAGDTGFTIDGFSGMSGSFTSSCSNITVQNCNFDNEVSFSGTGTGRVLYRCTHNNIGGSTTANRILIQGPAIIRECHLEGGGSDGVRFGYSATFGDVIVEDCKFYNIEDDGSGNHTDMMQFFGGSNCIVRRNWFKQDANNETQVIGAFDGTGGNLFENNVIDVYGRPWGIELYADDSSICRHNTIVNRNSNSSIYVDHKAEDPAGSGTEAYNNIARIEAGGSPPSTYAVNTNNMFNTGASGGNFNGTPTFQGGTFPSSWAGYAITSGSSGATGAIDGGPVGIRIG